MNSYLYCAVLTPVAILEKLELRRTLGELGHCVGGPTAWLSESSPADGSSLDRIILRLSELDLGKHLSGTCVKDCLIEMWSVKAGGLLWQVKYGAS